MSRVLAAVWLASVAALTACGPSALIRQEEREFPIAIPFRGTPAPKIPLKVCIETSDEGMSAAQRDRNSEYYRQWLSLAFESVDIGAPDCDVAVKTISSGYARRLDFRELSGGTFLFRAFGRFDADQAPRTKISMAEAVKARFSPEGALFKSIRRRAGSISAAAVASAAPAPAAAAPSTRKELSPNFAAAERPHDLAMIVGVETYSEIATKAPYAERDADAFKAYVLALGVPERNIVLLKGTKAGKASLEKNIEVWLPRMAKADSRVYFYFSGHGAPDVKTGQAYLVPWDGDPNFLEATAYPVGRLYKKLGELPSKQVLVAMDSCFSGTGGRSVVATGARPLVGKIVAGAPSGKVTVLSASANNEISGSLDDKGHGAFTYFLLEGLNAGKSTPKALCEYLTPRVQDEARRLNRDQTPQLQGDGGWSIR